MSSSNFPKISIITPSYNQGQYIEQTILSVIEQGYPNLEYIIIDGGSTDNTVEIIKKYEHHIAYWVSENDKGQSDAINKGFHLATGDVINWLNSDDYYQSGALLKIGEAFQDQSVNVYCGINRSFSESSQIYSTGTDVFEHNLSKTIGMARIDQPETFFRKSCLDQIGFVNESLHYIMDRDLWIRYLCKFGINNIQKEKTLLAHFRLHESSKTVSLKSKFKEEHRNLYYTYAKHLGETDYCDIFSDLFKVTELSLSFFPYTIQKADWKQVLNYFLLNEALEAYSENNYKLAKAALKNVNIKMLRFEEIKEMDKVLFRMKVVPLFVKKLYNKL